MTTIRCTLREKARVESVAGGFATPFVTDLATAFGGRGEMMGATEGLACALGSCILTMIALAATKQGLDLAGTTAEVTKKLVQDPHLRVSELAVVVRVPQIVEESKRAALEAAAKHCPIHRSLHPDVKAPIAIEWGSR